MVRVFQGWNDDDILHSFVIGKVGMTALLIDAGFDEKDSKDVLSYLKTNYTALSGVLLTDGTYKHTRGLSSILRIHKDVPVYLSRDALESLSPELRQKANLVVFDDDRTVKVHNSFSFEALLTPISSHGSVSYLFVEDNALFTGCMLEHPELLSGKAKHTLTKIKHLSPYTAVYPGNRPNVQLGEEIASNRLFEALN